MNSTLTQMKLVIQTYLRELREFVSYDTSKNQRNFISTRWWIPICICLGLLTNANQLKSQGCTNGVHFSGPHTPNSNWQKETAIWGGEYMTINITSGQRYNFSTCTNDIGEDALYNTQLTLTDNNGNYIAFNDDANCGPNGNSSRIDWTATYSGVARVYVHKNEGGGCMTEETSTVVGYKLEAQQQPDYRVTNLSSSATTASAGSTVSMSLRIENIGSAGGSGNGGKDRFYLSTDSNLDGGDIQIGEGNTSSLSAGQAFDVGGAASIPGNTAPGDYYILFKIDDDNVVNESNENNNVDSYFITITSGNPKPEYNATFFRGPSGTINAGNNITLTFDITNDGTAAGNGSGGNDKYYLSTDQTLGSADVFLKSSPTPSLAIGQLLADVSSGPLTIPANTPTGNYYILFFVDADDVIDESDENNNIGSFAINVQNNGGGNQPDYTVSNLSSSAITASAGTTVPMTLRIDNIGNGAGSGNGGKDRFYLSTNSTLGGGDVQIGEGNTSSLSAGQGFDVGGAANIPANTTPGDYYILFKIDDDNVIAESNENNNVASYFITITAGTPKPEYNATFFRGPSGTINAGNNITLTFDITNDGNAAGNGSGGNDKYYLSTDQTIGSADVFLKSSPTPSLSIGQLLADVSSGPLTIPANTPTGNYYILFFVDADNVIDESNESNNTGSFAISVQGTGGGNKPDYTSEVTGGPTSANAGGTINVTTKINNIGSANGTTGSKARYYLSTDESFSNDDVFLDEPGANGTPGIDFLPPISAGQSINEAEPLIIPSTTFTGNYYILYVVDADNEVAESNENNNVGSRAIAIQGVNNPKPEYNPSFFRGPSGTIASGTNVTLTFDMTNDGDAAGNGSGGFDKYYLSTDQTVGAGDVFLKSSPTPTLAIGQLLADVSSGPLTIPSNTPSGNYYILFFMDADNVVDESNENNNVGSFAINVEANSGPSNWAVTETGDNHTVIIETSIPVTINGSPIQVGDYIGAFYSDNGVEKCAGKSAWTGSNISVTVYGDDNSTGIKDGFGQNETFNWRVWKASSNQEFSATASYKPLNVVITHQGNFAINGISGLASLNGSSQQTQTIVLQPGWNMISSYIQASDLNMASIFSGIQSSIALVKNGRGNVYIPNPPINNIGNWDITQGYSVKVIANTPISLSLTGQKTNPTSTPISLNTGWNTISYLRDSDQSVETALAPIQGQIIIVKDGSGRIYSPQFNINNIGNLQAGKGYQVKVSSSASLTYTARIQGPTTTQMHTSELETRSFREWNMTGQNATLILHPNQGLEYGDEVGVFTKSGKLVGASVYEGHILGFPIWGDDLSTDEIDGLKEGEAFDIRVWKNQSRQTVAVEFSVEQGLAIYQNNGLIEISLQKTTSLENSALAANGLGMYPNPTTSSTNIYLELNQSAKVEMGLYSLDGKLIRPIISNQTVWEGSHSYEINTSTISAGIYLVRTSIDGQPHNMLLNVVK